MLLIHPKLHRANCIKKSNNIAYTNLLLREVMDGIVDEDFKVHVKQVKKKKEVSDQTIRYMH